MLLKKKTHTHTKAAKEKASSETLAEVAQRREVIKNKVMAMGKMQMMFSTLRQEKEKVVRLKGKREKERKKKKLCDKKNLTTIQD